LTPLLRLGIATRFAEDFGRPRAFPSRLGALDLGVLGVEHRLELVGRRLAQLPGGERDAELLDRTTKCRNPTGLFTRSAAADCCKCVANYVVRKPSDWCLILVVGALGLEPRTR
jgi:hypothetical protein